MRTFTNRAEAGKLLAAKLEPWRTRKPVVLALPRGGLPVAAEVAAALGAPLDILAVKKIGAPMQPELAMGAVSEDGIPVLNERLVSALDPNRAHLKRALAEKTSELNRQLAAYRKVMPLVSVKGRAVILVDDGLATGATMGAAVRVLKARGAAAIVVAVPVGSPQALESLRPEVSELVALMAPEEFHAVGLWYEDFSEVTDDDALAILARQGPSREGRHVVIRVEGGKIVGDFEAPAAPKGIIIFAHGSGSSRNSPRNRFVAEALRSAGFATLLFDLLTKEEARNRANVFDINLLAERLLLAKAWARENFPALPLGIFGASTGAAAALQAAAQDPQDVFAVVSRGGRPDMALASLAHVSAPTLLLVGGEDTPVIPLNRAAADRLSRARMVIIPGAGHLFEEPGKLEEVVEYSADWFSEHLPGKHHAAAEPEEDVVREALRLARPLSGEKALRELANEIAGSRVVMLGESTHGTREFYELRAAISRILIDDYGYNFIAVEGDWPACYELNRFVSGQSARSARHTLEGFRRWPTWMWANEETLELAEWMKTRRAGFYGLDLYSLFESLEVLRKHAMRLGPERGSELLGVISCFEPWERSEASYAKSLIFERGCAEEAADALAALLKIRLEDTRLTEDELFNVRENARLVKDAEAYYRAMLSGSAESWNLRDEHMSDTLERLLAHYGAASKGIVWAHNTHVGDYRFTDMPEEGYVNLGGLARERLGAEQVFLVGFGTYEGEVRAGKAWGAPEQIMRLPAAIAGSWEEKLHRLKRKLHHNQFSLVFDEESRKGALARTLGQRAVGVVYSEASEASGRNYVPTKLSRRYDAFVFVEKTTAVSSIHAPRERGLMPETWPSGQ